MQPECLDYVIIHELAHTKIHNHTARFWKMVYDIMPDYKERIKLLKQSAYELKLKRTA
jgi:predicted metal-dependent hydrolase